MKRKTSMKLYWFVSPNDDVICHAVVLAVDQAQAWQIFFKKEMERLAAVNRVVESDPLLDEYDEGILDLELLQTVYYIVGGTYLQNSQPGLVGRFFGRGCTVYPEQTPN